MMEDISDEENHKADEEDSSWDTVDDGVTDAHKEIYSEYTSSMHPYLLIHPYSITHSS